MLSDSKGNPVKKLNNSGVAGKDLVQCNILLENVAALEGKTVIMNSIQGKKEVPVQEVLTGLIMNLYSVLQLVGQKEMIVKLTDLSSVLVQDKKLTVMLGNLIQNKDDKEQKSNESEKEL